MCGRHEPSAEAVPRAATPPGRAASVSVDGRSSNAHQHTGTASGLPSECLLLYQDCWCPGILYHRTPRHFPNTNLRGSSMHHCRLGPLRTPRSICFPSNTSPWVLATVSFLHLAPFSPASCFFFQFLQVSLPTWLPKNIIHSRTKGTLLSFHTSELFSLALLSFCWAWLIKKLLKAQQFLVVPTWHFNTSPPEGLSTEQWAPSCFSADSRCCGHHLRNQLGGDLPWVISSDLLPPFFTLDFF